MQDIEMITAEGKFTYSSIYTGMLLWCLYGYFITSYRIILFLQYLYVSYNELNWDKVWIGALGLASLVNENVIEHSTDDFIDLKDQIF